VGVSGELDVATTPVLQTAVAELALRRLPITLDLSAVQFMDSTGLAALLEIRRDSSVGEDLVLLRPSAAVLRIFDLTKIAGLFEIDES
jgi:anti-anti-sigma factor